MLTYREHGDAGAVFGYASLRLAEEATAQRAKKNEGEAFEVRRGPGGHHYGGPAYALQNGYCAHYPVVMAWSNGRRADGPPNQEGSEAPCKSS